MKVSISWLKRYVDIDIPVTELCDKMVQAGFEVEEIVDLSATMSNVVVGKIVDIKPHEDSDHLQICQVDVGDEVLQIVTGAQNVFVGAIVPVAKNNSHLPNGANIKSGKLRGVESNGMLCSGEELCLTNADYEGAEVYGIMIMKDDGTPLGTDMRDVLSLNDYIVDFKITANRPDCQCVLGIAKEAAVVLGKEYKGPVPEYKTVGENISDYVDIDVKNYELCPRYVGRVIKNVRIKESPEWMKKCIIAAGMRPINNIVDITNFVMLETGQPMHAFDLRYVEDNKIIVRNAEQNEKMQTLDGKDYDLTDQMLVIADGKKPSCLAGIMGGLESEITADSHTVLFECAKFKRDNVRRTCRALGIRTEASSRFERGVDIINTEYAMQRALQLVYELDAGDIVDGVIDKNNGLPEKKIIKTTTAKILELLGIEVPEKTVVDILNSLHLETTAENGELTVKVPSIRDDVESRADLAEEVMRIYGCDHIIGRNMVGNVIRGKKLPERIKTDKIKNYLVGAGLTEIMTYSFIGSHAIDALNLKADDSRRNCVKLLNPLGDEYSTMRTQLLTSMLGVLSTNYNRKNKTAKLFEASKIFVPKSLPITEQPLEIPSLCIGMYGDNEDFFTLKGIVEELLDMFAYKVDYSASDEPYLHPGRQAKAVSFSGMLATFGELHPEVAEKYGIDKKVYVAEVDLQKLFEFAPKKVIFKPLPKFPAVTRDFSLVCDRDIPVAVLENAIRSGAGSLCEAVELFDVYTGEQIDQNKKSVSYSVTLRSKDGTLNDEAVEKTVNKIFAKLEKVGAELRK